MQLAPTGVATPASANLPVLSYESRVGGLVVTPTMYAEGFNFQPAPAGTTLPEAIEQAAASAAQLGVRPALGAVMNDAATGGFLVGASSLGLSISGQRSQSPISVTALAPGLRVVVDPDGAVVPMLAP